MLLYNYATNTNNWNILSWQHIAIIGIALLILISFAVIPKVYSAVSKNKVFTNLLAVLQVILFCANMIYKIIILAKKGQLTWIDCLPFNFVDLIQIISIIIIIIDNDRLFSMIFLFPFLGCTLSILFPSNNIMNLRWNNFLLYNYFIRNIFNIYLFTYLYLFSIREYERDSVKNSCLILLITGLIMYVINNILNTNFMMMTNNLNGSPVNFINYFADNLITLAIIINMFFIFAIVGLGGLIFNYLLFKFIKPIYDELQIFLHLTWFQIINNKIKNKFFNKKMNKKETINFEEID